MTRRATHGAVLGNPGIEKESPAKRDPCGLLIAWIIFVRATFMSMGWLGIILEAAFFLCVIWLFVDLGWLTLESDHMVVWLTLLLVSLILAVEHVLVTYPSTPNRPV